MMTMTEVVQKYLNTDIEMTDVDAMAADLGIDVQSSPKEKYQYV